MTGEEGVLHRTFRREDGPQLVYSDGRDCIRLDWSEDKLNRPIIFPRRELRLMKALLEEATLRVDEWMRDAKP